LDDACWKKAAPITGFVNEQGALARQQTIAYVLYDEYNLYIGFKCLEPNMKGIVTRHRDVGKRDVDVWMDDCVEVFVDTNNDRKTYYHLIFNSLGVKYDSYCKKEVHAASDHDNDWDGDWEVKTSLGKDGWYAEIAIPFSSLGITSNAGNTWGLGLARERKQNRENSSLAAGPLHSPENFPDISGIHVDFSKFCYQSKVKSYGQRLVGKNLLKMEVYNQGNKRKQLKAKLKLTLSANQSAESCADIDIGPGERQELEMEYNLPKEGKYKISLYLNDLKTGKSLYAKNEGFLETVSKFHIELVEPGYRNIFYENQKISKIKVKVTINYPQNVLEGKELRITIKNNESDKLVDENRYPAKTDVMVVDLPVPQAIGDYVIIADLLNNKGGKIAASKQPLHKLKSMRGQVRIDRFNRIIVDEKLFFPIYDFGGDGRCEKNFIDEFTDAGFNTFLCMYTIPSDLEVVKKYLDFFESNQMKVAYPLLTFTEDCMAKRCPGEKIKRMTEKVKEGIRKQVEALRNHPAIFAWYLTDEPDEARGGYSLAGFIEATKLIHSLDPYHPVLVTVYGGKNTSGDWAKIADIFEVHTYTADPSIISAAMETAETRLSNRGKRKSKPIIHAGEFFMSRQYAKKRNMRMLTAEDIRCQAYLPILYGAKGIGWFSWINGIKEQPELWPVIKKITKELKQLSPIILSPPAEQSLEVNCLKGASPTVDTFIREYKGKTYIIAVNWAKVSTKVLIILKKRLSRIKVLFENRIIEKEEEKSFVDEFKGYEVHVYEIESKK
jgi:hypothetical protein